MAPFKTIVADPPWKFGDKLPGKSRGAEKNYACMTTQDICRFPLPPIADDAVLFLWRVASMQQDALDVARMWGFTVKSELVWLKKTSQGNRWFGMGRTVRAEHEICLIATKGKPEIRDKSIRSTFVMDVEGLSAHVRRHSEKPAEFYDIVEKLCYPDYLELFSRQSRAGWTCLGDEVGLL